MRTLRQISSSAMQNGSSDAVYGSHVVKLEVSVRTSYKVMITIVEHLKVLFNLMLHNAIRVLENVMSTMKQKLEHTKPLDNFRPNSRQLNMLLTKENKKWLDSSWLNSRQLNVLLNKMLMPLHNNRFRRMQLFLLDSVYILNLQVDIVLVK
ncbi:hypothetical protein LXA43DRAFT_1061193 [Ganoderma leucocontextum]|nr:hypothetical protein LXA43DRAFT_1065393 [Ganoderma leucocontextum]KAI1791690.1 hypothetical protein LXA43DRAFT_1061193 [Ganoderma leucocontextum]